MVCAKCEKKYAKSSTLACTDVWRPSGPSGDRNATRKIGENKLLSSKRYTPYAAPAASGSSKKAAVTFDKCLVCKSTTSRVGAKYCQGCAYKKGICAMCATVILAWAGRSVRWRVMQFCCNDDATLRSILAKITVLASSPHAARMHILSFLTLLLPLAAASSTRPTPLHPRALSHPSAQSHRILTRTPSAAASLVSRSLDGELTDAAEPTQGKAVEWNHHWILRFTAHDKPLLFALRPSENVIHPDGVKLTETHVDPTTGRETTSIRVFKREEARIYTGWVIEPEEEEDWVRGELAAVERSHDDGRGYARITLLDDGIATDDGVDHELRWQGSYSLDNQLYTVHSTPTFLRTKETLDPEPPLLLKKRSSDSTPPTYDYPSMVIVREGDELTRDQQLAALKKRGLDVTTLPPPTVLGCGHDDLPFNSNLSHPVFTNQIDDRDITWTSPAMNLFGLTSRSATSYPPSLLHKRQADISGGMGRSSNFINSIGSKVGCPAQQTVVFIGVAADCTYTTQYGTADLARAQILTNFNQISTLYSRNFNVAIGIVELDVRSGTCPSPPDPSAAWNVGCSGLALNDRLSAFSAWRGAKAADGAGLWHLFTNCATGSEVGVAWLGALCTTRATTNAGQTTSGTAVTAATRSEALVAAHEIGHNFGAIHDCAAGCSLTNSNPVCCPLSTSTCDASAGFIMSPVSSRAVTEFSPCSIGNICTALGSSLNTRCLGTPGAAGNPALISLRSCGNGILEAGEDCDPGNSEDPCCNRATCKFAPNAVCSPTNSLCCTTQCQLAPAGQLCRPSMDARCDVAETCSGSSALCPADSHSNDGTSCGSGGLACASGVCSSRDLQCQNAGSSMGLRSGCPTRSSPGCSLACTDPSTSNQCIVLQQSFRDGTPCGYAGTCRNTVCTAGPPLNVAASWYRENLQISIPVTIVVAIIVFLIISAIVRCCIRKKRANVVPPSSRYNAAPPTSQFGAPPVVTGPNGRRLGRTGGPIGALRVPSRRTAPPPPSSLVPGGGAYNTPPLNSYSATPSQSFENVYDPNRRQSATPLFNSRSNLNSSTNIPAGFNGGGGGEANGYYGADNRFPPPPRRNDRNLGEPTWVDPTAWNGPNASNRQR